MRGKVQVKFRRRKPKTRSTRSRSTQTTLTVAPSRPWYVKYSKGKLMKDSELKQHGQDNAGTVLGMDPAAASRQTSYVLTSMPVGDTLRQRDSTTILNRFIRVRLQCTNDHTTSRMIRVAILGLRGSQNAADTTNWSDLWTDTAFNKLGPTGQAGNAVLRPNRDEYKVYFDRQYRIPGTADGVPNTKLINIYKKLNTLTHYEYNSTLARDGPLWLHWCVYEEAGTAATATIVNVNFRWLHYFQDVHRRVRG